MARGPSVAVLRFAARRCLRSAVVWGYVFGVTVASSALSYDRIYKDPLERQRLEAAFGANRAATALFGPAPRLQTVAGFTVFKVSMTLMVIGAVWGLLTSTRLLRGDEESGRSELLLSGGSSAGGTVTAVVGGLAAGLTVLWALTALVTVVVGRASSVRIGAPGALFFSVALVASAAMFLAVGALTSQLGATRRQAAGLAGAVLGASYALRMVADAAPGTHWLVWASPLGWVEELRPLMDPRPLALVPIALFTALLALLAVRVAARRDVGSAAWAPRPDRPARLALLSGPTALGLRIAAPTLAAWAGGLACCGLVFGIVARAAGTTVVGSSVQQVFTRLGAAGSGARTFLAVGFLIVSIVVAWQAATAVASLRSEEAEGRADQLLCGPVSRAGWFAARVLVGTGAVVLSALAAAPGAWAGADAQGAGLSLGSALGAATNAVPAALVVLGAGACAAGLWPRGASLVAYAVLGWSALVELVGGLVAENGVLLDTSVFHHVAAAPAVAPDWSVDGVLLAIALAAAGVGCAAFARRDLVTD